MKHLLAAILLVLAADGASAQRGSGSTSSAAYRLVVADANEPVVHVLDLEKGRRIATFKLKGPARLYRGVSGRYAYAAQADPGAVAVIDTGVAVEDHGDHADLRIQKPRLLPARLSGVRPGHVVLDGQGIAVFFDGDGTVQHAREQDLVAGKTHLVRRFSTGAKHHGVAQPIGAFVAVTVPPDGEGLPNAVALRGSDGSMSVRLDCPRLHGEAASGRFAAFGCADGVAVYERMRDRVLGRHIPYAAHLPPDRMIRTMAGATGFTFMVGNFGPDALVVFDPSAPGGDFRLVQLPARVLHFHLDAERSGTLYVLVEDGRLLRINPLRGESFDGVQITTAYPTDPGIPRPRISSAGPYIAVSNPAAGEIVVLDSEALSVRDRIRLKGAPTDVLAVGGRGTRH